MSGHSKAERETMFDPSPDHNEHVSLCEALDRVLNKGAVVTGEVTIAVADIDLIYLGLQIVLTSVETGREIMRNNESIRTN